jgi:hypothetical protein
MGIDFTQKNLSICEKSDGISNQKCSHFGASFQSRDGSELKPQMPACSLCSGPLRDHNGRRCTFSETSYAGRQTPARKCKNCREKMVRMCACVRARARARARACVSLSPAYLCVKFEWIDGSEVEGHHGCNAHASRHDTVPSCHNPNPERYPKPKMHF